MDNNLPSMQNHIHVTCAIIEREGRVLATQRSASMSMPNKWEFPGGKIDPGETDKDGRFTLGTVHCMGCCALGPVMTIDGVYYSKPTLDELKKVFASYD